MGSLEIPTQRIFNNLIKHNQIWVLILSWASQQQCPVSIVQRPDPRVQRPESRTQRLEPNIQSPAFRVHGPTLATIAQEFRYAQKNLKYHKIK